MDRIIARREKCVINCRCAALKNPVSPFSQNAGLRSSTWYCPELSGRIRRSAAPADHSEDAAGAGREAVGMFV